MAYVFVVRCDKLQKVTNIRMLLFFILDLNKLLAMCYIRRLKCQCKYLCRILISVGFRYLM